MGDGPAFKLGTFGPLSLSGAYVAAGERVQTPQGELPIEQVQVGQRVLSGCGRWAEVAVVRKLAYRGPMVSLVVEGSDRRVRMTPCQRLAIGPEHWVAIERLSLGTVVAVPLFSLPQVPPQGPDAPMAWLRARIQAGWVRASLVTPWGQFAYPVVPLPEFRLLVPRERFRILPAGLVALTDGSRAAVATMPPGSCLLRTSFGGPAAQPTGLELAEQSLRCWRKGDLMSFTLPSRPSRGPVKGLPRRVIGSTSRGYAGWVFSLCLDGADSFIASGLLTRHLGLMDAAAHGTMEK